VAYRSYVLERRIGKVDFTTDSNSRLNAGDVCRWCPGHSPQSRFFQMRIVWPLQDCLKKITEAVHGVGYTARHRTMTIVNTLPLGLQSYGPRNVCRTSTCYADRCYC